jgi:uncharacterized protein YndB with AHSA1/START domain
MTKNIHEIDKMGGQASSFNKTIITAEPGRQELFIIRELDAPRELVFRAYTDPILYAQWLGPKAFLTTVEKQDARDGGSWRYTNKDKDGNSFAFHGVYHEVIAPERIIETFEFEGLPKKGHVVLQTAKFEPLPNNRTKVTAQAVFMSVADRDGMIKSGMEWGVREGFERLDELLERLKKSA